MSIRAMAAVARVPSGPFAIEPVELEEPRPDEVIVRIAGVGLCHTDLVFAAHMRIMQPPAIFGHEGAGIVERVGANVTKVAPGDHVVLTFNSCGHCPTCDHGEPAYCHSFGILNNSGRRADGSTGVTAGGEPVSAHFFSQSSFATHALANERNVVRIDRDVPLELMGPLGCGVQTGAGAILNSLRCRAGSALVIAGAGAVGLSAVLGAVVAGCGTIIVAEPRPERRALALELGATHAIDPTSEDLAQAVRRIAPAGLDHGFDTSGIPGVITQLADCLAPHARLGLVGLTPGLDETLGVEINKIIAMGLTIVGIIEGDARPDAFIPEMVALYKQGRFPFDKLISTYPLDQINQAIADQHAGKCVKPVMLPANH